MVRKLFTKENITIGVITIIIAVIVFIYIITLGTRLTKARELYLEVYTDSTKIGLDNLSNADKTYFIQKTRESLNLWYDPEASNYLSTLQNL